MARKMHKLLMCAISIRRYIPEVKEA